jgi:hypothetical protein
LVCIDPVLVAPGFFTPAMIVIGVVAGKKMIVIDGAPNKIYSLESKRFVW